MDWQQEEISADAAKTTEASKTDFRCESMAALNEMLAAEEAHQPFNQSSSFREPMVEWLFLFPIEILQK